VVEIDRIEDEAAVLAALRQPGARKPGKMEGKRGGGEIEFLADLPCRHAFRTCLYQQPVDTKAGFLRQGTEGLYRLRRFHDSNNMET